MLLVIGSADKDHIEDTVLETIVDDARDSVEELLDEYFRGTLHVVLVEYVDQEDQSIST